MSVAYSEPYKRSKKYFAKIFNTEKLLSIFEKTLHLGYLTGFWIHLWMLKSIFNISKQQTSMQKKVRGDHASNVFFLANPAIQGLCLKSKEIELSLLFPEQLAKGYP